MQGSTIARHKSRRPPTLDRHAPAGLAMTTLHRHCEEAQPTRQSRGFAFAPGHAAHLPWIATPFGLAMTVKGGGLAMTMKGRRARDDDPNPSLRGGAADAAIQPQRLRRSSGFSPTTTHQRARRNKNRFELLINHGNDVMKNILNRFLAILCLVVLGTGGAGAASDYYLSTGDLVRISVYDHPDLITETRVSENGSILFPLIGQVAVGGLTAHAAAGRIAKGLETGGFIKSAQVNMVVLEFKGQEVSVLGYVSRPGKFPLQKRSRVIDVLAMAGGVVSTGADTLVLISNRAGKVERKEIDLIALFREGGEALNLEVANDDILHVSREPRFYIYGEVQRPGAFRLEKGMSVVQALALGGGLNPRGTHKGMRILRPAPDGTIQTLEEVQLADSLKPDDVIFVKESLF